MAECRGSDEKYSHSLSHFLFLSLKLGIYEEDLLRFVTNQIYKLPMEVESVIMFLFSFTRVEKIIGTAKFRATIEKDEQINNVVQFLIREKLFK